MGTTASINNESEDESESSNVKAYDDIENIVLHERVNEIFKNLKKIYKFNNSNSLLSLFDGGYQYTFDYKHLTIVYNYNNNKGYYTILNNDTNEEEVFSNRDLEEYCTGELQCINYIIGNYEIKKIEDDTNMIVDNIDTLSREYDKFEKTIEKQYDDEINGRAIDVSRINLVFILEGYATSAKLYKDKLIEIKNMKYQYNISKEILGLIDYNLIRLDYLLGDMGVFVESKYLKKSKDALLNAQSPKRRRRRSRKKKPKKSKSKSRRKR